MTRRPTRGRKLADRTVKVVSVAAAALGICVLAWILVTVARRGALAIDWDFFTELPAPPGAVGGGLANALLGTLIITALAAVIGIPVGMLAGVYLTEYGKGTRLGAATRATINLLTGTPSIIIGLFVYTFLVLPVGRFSGAAGAVALAIIMLPVVARTTEEMLGLVPSALRESALAVGAPRWRVTLGVVFRAARGGLITGVLLAVARVSGETAPLLFTALNSVYWPTSLGEPMGNLTVTIFNYAMSPYPDWQQAAWGASLVIMVAVLGLTVLARTVLKDRRT
jgi:phosphate transport system permease protein